MYRPAMPAPRHPSARAPLDRTARTARRLRQWLAICCVAVAGALPAAASAIEIEGVRLDEATRLGGKELQLNGAGLRSVFIVKGYVAALYLPEKVRNAAVVLGAKGPKRLQIRPLRPRTPIRSGRSWQMARSWIRWKVLGCRPPSPILGSSWLMT